MSPRHTLDPYYAHFELAIYKLDERTGVGTCSLGLGSSNCFRPLIKGQTGSKIQGSDPASSFLIYSEIPVKGNFLKVLYLYPYPRVPGSIKEREREREP